MQFTTFTNPDNYSVHYWLTKRRASVQEKTTARYIRKLMQYHRYDQPFDFNAIRDQQLLRLLKYAGKHCPYYREILAPFNLSDRNCIREIPFLTKDLVRSHENAMKSQVVPGSCFSYRKTGGSTGEPLGFWSTGNTEMIHQTFLFELHGYTPGDKILAMDGTMIDEPLLAGNTYWKMKNNGNMLPYGGMALSSLYLNDSTIPYYIDFLNSFKPGFIRGYPSFIAGIAKHILDKGISLDFQVNGIETTSEICFDSQVKLIREAFNTKVFGQYGHTEACVFGYTIDDSFDYYCSPLYGLTEVVGSNGESIAEGEEGEIVATGFAGFGFPFIRYRTGDRAIYGGEKDGIVKLSRVLGRTADFILNRNNEKVSLTALVFGQHYNAFRNINRWQIVQDHPGIVQIRIDRAKGFSAHDEAEIAAVFSRIGNVETTFDYSGEFIKTRAGKIRFVLQNVLQD